MIIACIIIVVIGLYFLLTWRRKVNYRIKEIKIDDKSIFIPQRSGRWPPYRWISLIKNDYDLFTLWSDMEEFRVETKDLESAKQYISDFKNKRRKRKTAIIIHNL